jgi:hypothetical protein
MSRRPFFLPFILAFFFAHYSDSQAQAITGMTGLLYAPSAEMQSDGALILGGSFLSKEYLSYGDYTQDAFAGYVNLTFLPFLELGFRYTYRFESINPDTKNFPDRMPSVRLRLMKEKEVLPALVVGIHDISSVKEGGAKYFEASYAVATKSIKLGSSTKVKTSLGYGFGIFEAQYHDIIGVFGGVDLEVEKLSWLSGLFEYDSRYWNTGIRVIVFKRLQIMPVLRNMRTFEGNVAYKIQL